jgi:hypothetical protein
MEKLSNFNKLFLAVVALLLIFIMWKVPHEGKQASKNQSEATLQ